MKFLNQKPLSRSIATSPAGRGRRPRPEIEVDSAYIHSLLEQAKLTERDEQLLKCLSSVTVLSALQIWRLLYFDTSFASTTRRLRRLFDYHLIDRTRMIDNEIIYKLDRGGEIWVFGETKSESNLGINVEHLLRGLAVAEIMVLLAEELRLADPDNHRRLGFEWRGADECRDDTDLVLSEPDAAVRLTAVNGFIPFCVQLIWNAEDLSTFENKLKLCFYNRHKIQSHATTGTVPEAVMIITATEKQANKLAEMIVARHCRYNGDVSWFITSLKNLNQLGFFSDTQHWQIITPGRNTFQLQSLKAPWRLV